jgi:pimeloyl-ACP methyl ester carboxylesterase
MTFEENKTGSQAIHYQIQGEGPKSVVLVHGLPSSHLEWNLMSQRLVSAGYRTIALDLPGHGDSLKPDEIEFYSTNTFSACFNEWLMGQNLDPAPVLIGHSFGGHLCLRYTLEHQRQMAGLILINPFLSYRQLPGINRSLLSYPPGSTYLLRNAPFWLLKSLIWAGSLVRRKNRIVSFLSKSELHNMAVDFKRCSPKIAYLPATVRDVTTNLADLHLPTTLIWGKNDRTLSVSWYLNTLSKLPHAGHKVLNAGHSPHLSNFNEVYPVVLDFLASTFSP